jgi:3-oxoacyl-(acyl-carrier-protein) synthase
LRSRKTRKFMGPQDEMAVAAAGAALEDAGLAPNLGERAGVYFAVGFIPFERAVMDDLLAGSTDERGFSMQRLSTAGYGSLNPLMTFRCLSNMPAFHISLNFDIQGPYFVTYPGAGQFYLALEQALLALAEESIDIALVGGVAHQKNFLVEQHFTRIQPPVSRLEDAAGCVILERAKTAGGRSAVARARLDDYSIAYRAHDPFQETPASSETGADTAMGAASLPVALCSNQGGALHHSLRSRDGIHAHSSWSIL